MTDKTQAYKSQCQGLSGEALILKGKSEGKLVSAKEDWARQQIASNRAGFVSWLATRPNVLLNSAGGGKELGRHAIINSAGAAFDQASTEFQRTFNRTTHINSTLRDMELDPLSDEELDFVSASGQSLTASLLDGGTKAAGGSPRAKLINSQSSFYRSKPDLAKMGTSERTFINGQLIAANLAALTEAEAAEYSLVG